ncbi:MAG: DJ-1/PfpI family protein [Myxococcota bacterium]
MELTYALYDGMTLLDFAGPNEVLSHLPGMNLHYAAAEAGPVTTDTGLQLGAQESFAEITATDVLVVPGGTKTQDYIGDTPIVRFIRRIHPTTTWTTSVCTGSLLLASAGVLDGLTATTHWSAMDALAQLGATPTSQRVVRHEGIMTGAGVSAGIDMALTLLAELLGEDMAKAIQLGIEYDPQPPFDSGAPHKASEQVRSLAESSLGG